MSLANPPLPGKANQTSTVAVSQLDAQSTIAPQQPRENNVASMPYTDRRIPALERKLSAGNALSLSSNNPFRRAAPSTALFSNQPSYVPNGDRQPPNTNPFHDNFQTGHTATAPNQRPRSPVKQMAPPSYRYHESPRQLPVGGVPAELISGLSLSDKPVQDRNVQPRGPPAASRTFPVPSHRHARSQEEARRARDDPRGGVEGPVDVFANPKKSEARHSRHNSDSSVMEARDEERKQRDARRRDRDGRHKHGKTRDGRSSKPKRPNPHMDVIDKLDVTSIYGTGLFHHDGPFDACNPQRNRMDARSAPMKAFAEGSANNALGGSGPVNKAIDIDRFHGRGAEGFSDFNDSAPADAYTGYRRPERPERAFVQRDDILDPKSNIELVHGEETAGLGTSTFLEGAPAPARAAGQHRPSEVDSGSSGQMPAIAGPGLLRKKSVAQRIRGTLRPQRPEGLGEQGRVTSPESRYIYTDGLERKPTNSPPSVPLGAPPMPNGAPLSGGGRGKMVEMNPFFNSEGEKKGMSSVRESELDEPNLAGLVRNRTMSSPQRPLFRTKTSDNTMAPEAEVKTGGGLMSRVRSLRGGKRAVKGGDA